jgi:uncharacterized membrane protein
VDQLAIYGFALVPGLVVLALRLPSRARIVAAVAVVAALLLALVDDLGGPALLAVAGGAAVWLATRSDRTTIERFGALLFAGACGCAIVPELVYLRDAFDGTEYFRLNTSFKVGFDAWLLFAAAAALLLSVHVTSSRAWVPLLAVMGVCLVSFPFAAAWVHTGRFKAEAHLDGLRWLTALAPGDPPAIRWLRKHTPGDTVVLEANGPEYSPAGHGRISVFTGRPTVLGWAGHELFYHPATVLGTRAQDIQAIYSSPDPSAVGALLARYRVEYVVVGPVERSTYPGLDPARLGDRVFARDGTEIFRVVPRR